MTIASIAFRRITVKKQSGLGVAASGASAQRMRFLDSTSFNKKKAFYESNEIRPSMMVSDGRHGVISVDGTLNAETSVGTYQAFMGSALRSSAWIAGVSSGALIDVTAAVTTGAFGTFTTAAANFLTLRFKVRMTIRWTGWTTTGVPNNAHNFVITALTSTVMTGYMLDGVAVGAKAAGDSVTALSVGKHNYIPQTGHVKDYWTIEDEQSDIAQSQQYIDCVVTGMNVKLPATGMSTIDFPIMGLNMTTGTASVFTSPTAITTGKALAAANGAVFVQGLKVGVITSIDFGLNGNCTVPGGVVGSNVDPDVFQGTMKINGNMSILFDSVTLRDYFLAETLVSVIAIFTTDNTASSDFMAFSFPAVKINSFDLSTSGSGRSASCTFVALEDTTGGTGTDSFQTAIVVQDSTVS